MAAVFIQSQWKNPKTLNSLKKYLNLSKALAGKKLNYMYEIQISKRMQIWGKNLWKRSPVGPKHFSFSLTSTCISNNSTGTQCMFCNS